MGIIKAGMSNVQAPNGGSLAIYIDTFTDEVMLKDINGNIESLSNFIKAGLSNESQFYLLEENNCIRPNKGNNSLIATNSVILSGEFNVNRGNFSIINGGESNTTANDYSIVNGGKGNTVDANFGIINGGCKNNVDADFSSVLAGENNKTNKHTNSHIIGSNLVADADDTTFVNQLSIKDIKTSSKGLKKGMLWLNNGSLDIVR